MAGSARTDQRSADGGYGQATREAGPVRPEPPLRLVPAARPTLVINPSSDEDFVERVSRVAHQDGMTPEMLQGFLHDRHPEVVVRRRELSGEPNDVWYVYRDGRWIPPGDRLKR